MRRTAFDLGKTFTITIVMLILPFIVGIINIGTVVDYKLGVATALHAAPTFIFFAAWALLLFKSRSQLIPLFISLLYCGICSVGAAYIANVAFPSSSVGSSEAATQSIISILDNILMPVYGHCVFFDEPDAAFTTHVQRLALFHRSVCISYHTMVCYILKGEETWHRI